MLDKYIVLSGYKPDYEIYGEYVSFPIHKEYGTIHFISKYTITVPGKTACGRLLTGRYCNDDIFSSHYKKCKTCFSFEETTREFDKLTST